MLAKENKKTRSAIYARVSTLYNGQNPETQLQPLRDLARIKGWNVIGEFVDVGQSGAAEHRPELDRMMEAVRNGEVDCVAVWRFDRFARSVSHLLTALEEFRASDVEFLSLSESIDTTSSVGKMVFTFLGAVAEFERSLIIERIHAGINRAKAAGKRCGRPRKKLDLRAAYLLLDQGHSVRTVAEMLDISRSTLRRRLAEEESVGQNPPSEDEEKSPEIS